jgi:O-antigen/teichoic acid export membrane protein
MASRVLWRRSATAAGTYLSVVLGVLGSLIAARALGPHRFGLLSIVIVAAGFFQVLLDLTVEEAMIKFGFRYSTAEDWGRLRRLFRRAIVFKGVGAVCAVGAMLILAPFADGVFNGHGLLGPMLIASALPLLAAPEAVAGAVFVLHGRYDVRAYFLTVSMALRLAAYGVGSQHGVQTTILAIVVAQVAASVLVGVFGLRAYRRFPAAAPVDLRADRPEIVRFVVQSSIATGFASLRGAMAPFLLGIVTTPAQVAFFRTASAPQVALNALSSPARLILLTEQTRDWERDAATPSSPGCAASACSRRRRASSACRRSMSSCPTSSGSSTATATGPRATPRACCCSWARSTS